jgi:hypothetical protein
MFTLCSISDWSNTDQIVRHTKFIKWMTNLPCVTIHQHLNWSSSRPLVLPNQLRSPFFYSNIKSYLQTFTMLIKFEIVMFKFHTWQRFENLIIVVSHSDLWLDIYVIILHTLLDLIYIFSHREASSYWTAIKS